MSTTHKSFTSTTTLKILRTLVPSVLNIKFQNIFLDYSFAIFIAILLTPVWLPLAFYEVVVLKPNRITHYMRSIESMSGKEFEEYLKILFINMGFKIIAYSKGVDQGGDLIVSKNNKNIVIQAKRHKEKVSNGSVQEVAAAIGYYKCANGIVVTNSSFTESAKRLADANNIELIDGSDLKKLIRLHGI